MKGSIVKRLEDLEKQQEEPPKIRLRGFDEESDPDVPHIKLKWLDEVRL
jgi:hypothetical protein